MRRLRPFPARPEDGHEVGLHGARRHVHDELAYHLACVRAVCGGLAVQQAERHALKPFAQLVEVPVPDDRRGRLDYLPGADREVTKVLVAALVLARSEYRKQLGEPLGVLLR